MFDRAAFVEYLAKTIAEHLRERAPEFVQHRLGAVALDTHPWHKGTMLSVLIETDRARKWDIGGWEHQEFAELDGLLQPWPAYDKLQAPDGAGSRYAPFFRAAAEALCHRVVRDALKLYTLEPDFELFVGDPDDPNDVNCCDEFIAPDPKKRKVKTEVVDDLNEALKYADSLRVLKYWYHDKFTKADGEKIAQLFNLEELHLISMGLKTLPACVLALPRLTALELDFNQLTSLKGLGGAQQLRLLSLRGNGQMTPAMVREIAALTGLRQLRIGACGLREVPDAFEHLQALEEIYLFENPLAQLPDWLPALPNLKRLGLVEAVPSRTKTKLRKRHPHLEIW
jgi:hypothetical protein